MKTAKQLIEEIICEDHSFVGKDVWGKYAKVHFFRNSVRIEVILQWIEG